MHALMMKIQFNVYVIAELDIFWHSFFCLVRYYTFKGIECSKQNWSFIIVSSNFYNTNVQQWNMK